MRAALLTSTLIHAGAFAAALGMGVLAAGSEPARALWVTVPGANAAEVPGLVAEDAPEPPEREAQPRETAADATNSDADAASAETEASLEPALAPAAAGTPEPGVVAEVPPLRGDPRSRLDEQALVARVRRKSVAPAATSARTFAAPASPAPGGAPALPGSLAAEALVSENVPPPYPQAARRAAQEGTVWLELELDAQGNVTQASLASSSGHALLDAAALSTVRTWRYRPALEGGRPVASRLRQPVVFRLTEAP